MKQKLSIKRNYLKSHSGNCEVKDKIIEMKISLGELSSIFELEKKESANNIVQYKLSSPRYRKKKE